MQSGVDIDVVDLIVVLNKGRPEQIFGKGQVDSRPYQYQIRIILRLWHSDSGIVEIHRYIGQIPQSDTCLCGNPLNISSEILSKFPKQLEI